jgi:predicted outer membrane repeat protein
MTSSIRCVWLIVLLSVLPGASTHATIILIKPDGSGTAPTIQAGVDAAAYTDTVLLASGTYTGVGNRDVDFKGKAITISSQDGPAATVIDCENLGRGFIFLSGEAEGSVLSGVTITNGSADEGGAVYAWIAKPTILDNIISNNTATTNGGGIFVYGAVVTASPARIAGNIITGNIVTGSPGNRRGGGLWVNSTDIIIEHNTISWNTANEGGGVWLSGDSDNIFRDNVITNNTAQTSGGGVYVSGYSPIIEDNSIENNDAGSWGGGMYADGSSGIVDRCVMAGNTAGFLGGGVYFFEGTPTLRNGTMVGNTGSGAVVGAGSTLSVEKSIISFNNTSAVLCFSGSVVTTSCSDLYGNTSDALCGIDGGHNFSLDPLFCDGPSDYHISPDSPCTAENSPCGELVGALPECNPAGVFDGPQAARTVLHQNYPNPFNPTTTIRYEIAGAGGHVTLAVYDVDGRLVATLVDEHQTFGVKYVTWNGENSTGERVASGVYFYRLTAPGFNQVRKMTVLK